MNRTRKQKGRDVSGVLLLDKPAGITSNGALQTVKRLYGARKAGHTGSLDRPARGMLPVCFGEATKFTSYLLNADKRYVARCQLGTETTTGDATGEVTVVKPVPVLDPAQVRATLAQFEGEIMQVPPMHSALKHKGQRLYKLAYQGIEVEREPRPVTVYSIRLLDLAADSLEIEVHCSKGTYIRTLVEDIGRRMGCAAHTAELVRTAVGPFSGGGMIKPEQIEDCAQKGTGALDELLLPIDRVLADMPEVTLADSVSCYLEQGQPVIVPHAPTAGMLRMYNERYDFIGVGEVLDDGRIAPRRLVNTPPE